MKKIIYILAIPLLALFAASCDQSLEGTKYRPNSDDNKEIHFNVSKLEKSFAENDKAGLIELTIVRPGNVGDHTLKLSQMGSDESIFTFPEYVTIEDGNYSQVVPILVNLKKCVKGSSYATSIYIVERDQATGDYGARNAQYSDAVDISVSIELTWEPYMVENPLTHEMQQQTATYNYNAYWHGTGTGLLVEKAQCEETFYRLCEWGTNNVYLMWMVKDDNSCVLPKQNTGSFNSNYNQYIYVSDYPSDIYASTSYKYSSYPCTWDGDKTFTFNVIYYREGSTGNFGKGVETIVFEDLVPPAAQVSIKYNGVDSMITGFVGAKMEFTPNAQAKGYSIAIYDSAISDSTVIAAIGDSLFNDPDGIKGAATVKSNLYGELSESWNLSNGPHTVVASAFNENGEKGVTTSRIFTFDPAGDYAVQVRNFTFTHESSSSSYDPSSSLHFNLKTTNLARGWYACRKVSAWNSLLKTKTLEEILTSGSEMSASFITKANSTSGYTGHYSNLSSGTEYMVAMVIENAYGERQVIQRSATTEATSKDSKIDDFKKDVTVNDFIGSFLMSAGVGNSLSTTSEQSFRVDVNKMNDNKVIISGLGSTIEGFDPEVVAYFDAVRHCLVVDVQNIGMFKGDYIRYAMYTGSSYVYASGALLLGWINDEIVWVSDPDYSSYTFVGYTFMQFSSEKASSETYKKSIVDSKVYVNPKMEHLEHAIKEE